MDRLYRRANDLLFLALFLAFTAFVLELARRVAPVLTVVGLVLRSY